MSVTWQMGGQEETFFYNISPPNFLTLLYKNIYSLSPRTAYCCYLCIFLAHLVGKAKNGLWNNVTIQGLEVIKGDKRISGINLDCVPRLSFRWFSVRDCFWSLVQFQVFVVCDISSVERLLLSFRTFFSLLALIIINHFQFLEYISRYINRINY